MIDNDTIEFGSYPQSEVTDETLIDKLNEKAGTKPTAANSQKWTSYKYYISGNNDTDFMWYIDVEEGGEKYRGVYFTSYRPCLVTEPSTTEKSQQDNNKYDITTVYWFEYEPISWTVLEKSYGEALILCDMIIDSQEYYIANSGTRTIDGNTVYPNNYAYSTIRKWLNETFYNTAFNKLQKQIILTTTVDNSESSTGYSANPNACEDTQDKIFLLSYKDLLNSNYGFSSSYDTEDAARQKKTTDYAQAQGVIDNAGNGWWWLRSPYNSKTGNVRAIDDTGYVYGYHVYATDRGVVPALHISLDGDLKAYTSYTEDGVQKIKFGSYQIGRAHV